MSGGLKRIKVGCRTLDVRVTAILFAPWAQAHCVRSVAATGRLKMERKEESGIAFGEAGSISSPPSRSQMYGRPKPAWEA